MKSAHSDRDIDIAIAVRACTALRLIAERGYQRGKDLLADFETLLRERDKPRGS